MDIEKLIEQIRAAADKWEAGHQIILTGELRVQDALRDAATALSTLQAENEKLRAELERHKEKNAGLALALLTECAPNPDCLGDNEWRAIRAELEMVKRERDAAINEVERVIEQYIPLGPFDRLRELVQADRDGRLEIIEHDVAECVKTVKKAQAALRREQDEQIKP